MSRVEKLFDDEVITRVKDAVEGITHGLTTVNDPQDNTAFVDEILAGLQGQKKCVVDKIIGSLLESGLPSANRGLFGGKYIIWMSNLGSVYNTHWFLWFRYSIHPGDSDECNAKE